MKIIKKIKEYAVKNKWVDSLFWIIVAGMTTLIIERSCNRIIPDAPIVVKEVSDTLKVVHSYDFGSINDSLINVQLKNKLQNIELAQQYEAEIVQKGKSVRSVNSIMLDVSFPNSKGYVQRSALSFFTLEISSVNEKVIDFEISFFDNAILNEIYCLTLKIFKLENNTHIIYDELFYNVNDTFNLIRIANSLPEGTFEFCVGIVFKKDRMKEYPNTYQIKKVFKVK